MLEYLPELRDENEFGEIKMKTIVLNISPIEVMSIASGFQDYLYRVYFPKITPPFKCLIYCRNKRPLIAFADYLYCGYWQTDVCEISGYSREAAEDAFDIINDKICGEFVCDGYKKSKILAGTFLNGRFPMSKCMMFRVKSKNMASRRHRQNI